MLIFLLKILFISIIFSIFVVDKNIGTLVIYYK